MPTRLKNRMAMSLTRRLAQHVLQEAEVADHHRQQQRPQAEDELALGDEVRLARLVDELGDLQHRLVHGQVLQLAVLHEAEDQTEHAHHDAGHQQLAAVERVVHERLGGEIRQDKVRLASAGGTGGQERQDSKTWATVPVMPFRRASIRETVGVMWGATPQAVKECRGVGRLRAGNPHADASAQPRPSEQQRAQKAAAP